MLLLVLYSGRQHCTPQNAAQLDGQVRAAMDVRTEIMQIYHPGSACKLPSMMLLQARKGKEISKHRLQGAQRQQAWQPPAKAMVYCNSPGSE
jgi:hypothetical protein